MPIQRKAVLLQADYYQMWIRDSGEVVTELGTKIKRSDVVKFHEEPVSIERKVYVLLNKPKDTVTTSDDRCV